MRYLTRDMQTKMQFFSIAFEKMDLQSLIEEWSNSEHPIDVYEMFYKDIEHYREDMLRLLPEVLKNKIFNSDGSPKADILNEELYRDMVEYKKGFRSEWKNAWRAVADEMKRIEKTLPESIGNFTKLYLHDEGVTAIYFKGDNKLVIELEEKIWGKPLLIFKGVEKAEILNEIYPSWWLYDELFGLDDGKYELNALLSEGEISIVFTDFEIKTSTKDYLKNVIEEFSPEGAKKKIEEAIKRHEQIDGKYPSEETISYIAHLNTSDEEFFHEVSKYIDEKEHFAGRNSLNKMEIDISLLNRFITKLLWASAGPSGFTPGGFQNIEAFSGSELDRIINLLSNTGPEYLYRLAVKAKSVFELAGGVEKVQNIKKLNARIKLKYSAPRGNTDEIYRAFADYIKANHEIS